MMVNICQGDNILAGSLLGVYNDTTTTQFSRRTDLWDDEDEEEDW